MPMNFRLRVFSIVSVSAFLLVLASGCSSEEPSPATPAASSTPAPGPAPAKPAPSPAEDLREIKQELQQFKKDVTPPVIIKPDVQPAPGSEPRKTG
jgi:hypothetical protein